MLELVDAFPQALRFQKAVHKGLHFYLMRGLCI
jgi:hypothetical protein